jgi:hypothetical protein
MSKTPHLQVLALNHPDDARPSAIHPDLCQIHVVSESEYRKLRKDNGMVSGKVSGIPYVGIGEYVRQMDVSAFVRNWTMISEPNSYQFVERS